MQWWKNVHQLLHTTLINQFANSEEKVTIRNEE